MRSRIRRFNESKGGINDDQNGYHETMTVFWLAAIKHYAADEQGNLNWNQEMLDDLIFNEELSSRNLWTKFYSKELMMSVKARREYVEPDIQSI